MCYESIEFKGILMPTLKPRLILCPSSCYGFPLFESFWEHGQYNALGLQGELEAQTSGLFADTSTWPQIAWIRPIGRPREIGKPIHDFLILWVHGKHVLKWPQMWPRVFVPTNPDLVDILGETMCHFEDVNILHWLGFWPSSSPGSAFTFLVRRRCRRTNSQIPTWPLYQWTHWQG